MIRAFIAGVRDGMESGGELTFGRTYDGSTESARSKAYDHGANIGEALSRAIPLCSEVRAEAKE